MASSRSLVMAVLVLAIAGVAVAQQDCTLASTQLAPCLTYVTGPEVTPPSSCCQGVMQVNRLYPTCLCTVFGQLDASNPAVNVTKAYNLPKDCNVLVDTASCPSIVAPPLPGFAVPPGIALPPVGMPPGMSFPPVGVPPGMSMPPVGVPPGMSMPPVGVPPGMSVPPMPSSPPVEEPTASPPTAQPPVAVSPPSKSPTRAPVTSPTKAPSTTPVAPGPGGSGGGGSENGSSPAPAPQQSSASAVSASMLLVALTGALVLLM